MSLNYRAPILSCTRTPRAREVIVIAILYSAVRSGGALRARVFPLEKDTPKKNTRTGRKKKKNKQNKCLCTHNKYARWRCACERGVYYTTYALLLLLCTDWLQVMYVNFFFLFHIFITDLIPIIHF